MEQEQRTVKIIKYTGKVLTVKIKEQTDEYISGFDRDGVFVKIQLSEIQSAEPPTREVVE